MDKPLNKSNESTISTTGTTGSPQFSDNLENNVKYINLNFVDNSESSSQAKDAGVEFQKIPQTYEAVTSKTTKPPPSKILPSNIPLPGKYENQKPKTVCTLKEKSLLEMGFKTNEIQGWEDIVQPPKESLYKLLRNMIDNHIKPNVQIRIGGVTFNCHMMVLQCYSDFFMECNNEVLIQLPEEKITPGAFMMVYDWMLAEEPLVQREGILELFNAANFLRIKNLVNQCWLCLDDDVRFREDTAFLLYLEARNYKLESLEQLMLTRICKFFLTLVASKEYLELTTKEICTLLSSNTIGVNSEIEIFMSIVRWLNYNWDEREADMLEVTKCVRFSLMPPWFLVTLNKNIDCVEIDRIASHPEVKRMINDGISYTTTQLYYGENREEFLHFLERYQLVAPVQRQWVFDKECNYHHRLECPNMQYVTYKSFLEYIEMIHTIGKDYWRSLEMAKSVEKTMQCCVRSDCRKLNGKNLASIFTMQCRDQGVQVETSLRQRKPFARDQRYHGEQNMTVLNSSSLKNCSKMTTTQVPPSTPTSCHEFTYIAQCEQHHHHNNNRHQQQHLRHLQEQNQQQSTNYNYNYNKNNTINDIAIPTEQHEMKCDAHRILNDEYEQVGGEMNHCVEGGYICRGVSSVAGGRGDIPKTMIPTTQLHTKASQTPCNNVRESKATCPPRIENHNEQRMAQQSEKQHMIQIVQALKSVMPTAEEVEFKAIKGRKILIFGGIDPYCQHCLRDNVMTTLQQQRKNFKVLGGSDADNMEPLHNHNGVGGCGTCGGVDSQANRPQNFGDRVLYYVAGAKQWKHLCFLPFGSRHHHAALVCNGLIYIIGGTKTALGCTKKSIFEKSVWSFDPQTIKWTFECNLPEPRRDFAAIVSDEFCGGEVACERCKGIKEAPKQGNGKCANGFFVIGGEGVNETALRTVWYYNILHKTWKKKAPLNVGRYGLMAAMVNNEIWIAGGIIETKTRASAESDCFAGVSTTAVDINGGGGGGGDGVGNGAAKGGNGSGDSFAVETTKSAVVDVITDSMEYYSLKCAYGDEYVSDMPMPRANDVNGGDAAAAAAAVDIGDGSDIGDGTLPTLRRRGVSVDGGRWIKGKQHLRIPRLFGKFCRPSEKELYLVGGIGFNSDGILTSLSSVDHYNFSEGHWHHYGDIKWGRHGHDIATLNDRIVIIGGVSTIKRYTLTKVETFCMKTRRNFKDMPDLPWPLSGSAVLALD
ncbi:uncharacterized protein LOC129238966 [Anastrepha obliqua]|uniref:uncharacterized protein LOC129238966 n=1 Tax=Anastrepha obliqua TaxID=95512 RepID=UPI00240954B2|nr:uncharacterized protein LOC129238966 [Anastrepha obliqua]